MLQALDNPDRLFLVIGALLYGAAFIVGLLPLLLRRNYPAALVSALTTLGFALQTIGLNLRGSRSKDAPSATPLKSLNSSAGHSSSFTLLSARPSAFACSVSLSLHSLPLRESPACFPDSINPIPTASPAATHGLSYTPR